MYPKANAINNTKLYFNEVFHLANRNLSPCNLITESPKNMKITKTKYNVSLELIIPSINTFERPDIANQ